MTLFLVSDTHFGHKQIMEYEKRPFRSVEGMDEGMIHRWNGVVGKQDIVLHLGDFSFYSAENTKKIFDKLRGRKRLILGNHDKSHSSTWWKKIGFEDVSRVPIIWEGKYILSHEPIEINIGDFLNVHGHVHSSKDFSLRDSKRHFNVSVDVTAFRPVTFDSIMEEFKKRGVQ